jgi:hypothetical protein
VFIRYVFSLREDFMKPYDWKELSGYWQIWIIVFQELVELLLQNVTYSKLALIYNWTTMMT